jgi:metallo-beta-lactamase family protein
VNQQTLAFHGAARTVTGSKYLIEGRDGAVLVDCGLFQGEKTVRVRNWQALPFKAHSLAAVLLTHAHLDHAGMLPVLHRAGFDGPVYCTPSTRALAEILLPDSGRIHEEDARHANRHGYSRHHPAQPLYTEAEAFECLRLLKAVDFGEPLPIAGLEATFRYGGHILGASWLELTLPTGRRIVFSGDVGRPEDPIMRAPDPLTPCDVLILESTYGGRLHDATPAQAALRDVVERTRRRGGMVLIPAFAVGRAQAVLYLLWQLKRARQIGNIAVYLDSPMAVDATEIFRSRPADHRLDAAEAQEMCTIARYVTTREESRALNGLGGPMIVVSASGMMSGGRVLHHLRNHAGDPRNTILFTGYQAQGTRGADILAGARKVKIHGLEYPIRAEIAEIAGLSAHADQGELLEWIAPVATGIEKIYLTHGEPTAARHLARGIAERFGVHAQIAAHGERVSLG